MTYRTIICYVLLLHGCLRADLEPCMDGRLCPAGTLCDVVHASCATPDQFAVCASVPEGADCTTAAIVGACFDGVCLLRGCGNRVVEATEQCDDGNLISNDGCRSDCRSTEQCGNGVLDPEERCDDGNRRSRDGCDSICEAELADWTVVPTAPLPSSFTPRRVTYDSVRGRVVSVNRNGVVWSWDGDAWTYEMPAVPQRIPGAVVFDRNRGRIVIVSGRQLFEWDGALWIERATTGGPDLPSTVLAVYDEARAGIVVIANGSTWFLSAANAWQQEVVYQDLGDPQTALFDPVGNHVLVFSGSAAPGAEAAMWTYDGTQFTPSSISGPSSSGWGSGFDRARGRPLLVGGTTSDEVWELDGTTWVSVPALTLPEQRSQPAVAFDERRGRLVVLGGTTNTPLRPGEILEYDTAWSRHISDVPPFIGARLANEPERHRIILYGKSEPDASSGETWAWDTSWVRPATSVQPPLTGKAALAYDSRRQAVIMATPSGASWLWSNDEWQPLGACPADIVALAFDPLEGRAIAATHDAIYVQTSPVGTWSLLAASPPAGGRGDKVTSLAWSPRDHRLVAAMASFSTTYELAPGADSWVVTLSPGLSYLAVESPQRGSVELIPELFTTLMGEPLITPIWERSSDAQWIKGVAPAWQIAQGAVAYERSSGRLLMVGADGDQLLWMTREYRSALPTESCAATEDLDQDELAGCADPDCWWSCTPSCPPYTSCP